MKILKLFKKYFCIALLGLVLAGWKFSLQAARQAQKVNSINAWIQFDTALEQMLSA